MVEDTAREKQEKRLYYYGYVYLSEEKLPEQLLRWARLETI